MRALPAIGATLVGVLILAIGVVLGMVWESNRTTTSATPSAVDVGFAQDMSEHHDQAILMARTLSADVAPDIRGLADRIVAAQSAESATMRGWLTWFGQPQSAEQPMVWMSHGAGPEQDGPEQDGSGHDHGASPHSSTAAVGRPAMSGMASVQDIQRLAGARGVEAEVLFLQLMLRHHEGGVEMASSAHQDPRAHSATKQLALSMIGEQGEEIGLMRLLLLARGAEPLAE